VANVVVKLMTLKEKQARLIARISQLENQQKKQARKEDTRLKVLIGAGMLADAETHPESQRVIRLVLARAITAERDREFLKSKGWL
jgi:hypothetical protein